MPRLTEDLLGGYVVNKLISDGKPAAQATPAGLQAIQQTAQNYQDVVSQHSGEDLARTPDFVAPLQDPVSAISLTGGEIPAYLQNNLTTVGQRLVGQAAAETASTLKDLYAQEGIQEFVVANDGVRYAFSPISGEYKEIYDPNPSGFEVATKVGLDLATGGLFSSTMGMYQGIKEGDVGAILENGAKAWATMGVGSASSALDAAKASGNIADIANASQALDAAKQVSYGLNAVSAAADGNYGSMVTNGLLSQGVDPVQMVAENVFNMTPDDYVLSFDNPDDPFSDAVVSAGNWDAVSAATTNAIGGALDGQNLDKIAQNFVIDYIKEGGDLGDFSSTSSFDFETPESLKQFDKEVLQPIKETVTGLVGQGVAEVAELAQTIDDNIIDPTVSVVKKAIDPIQEVADPILEQAAGTLGQAVAEVADVAQTIDDEVIDPIVAAIKENVTQPIGNAIEQGGKAINEAVIEPTVAAVSNVIDTVDQAIRDIPNPTIDLPTIDMPSMDIPVPRINLGSLFNFGKSDELDPYGNIIKYMDNTVSYDSSIEDLANLLLSKSR